MAKSICQLALDFLPIKMWLRYLIVVSLSVWLIAMIIQSCIQFLNPDIGVETTTENKVAKFPSLTFCSLIYNISVPRVFQNSNATFDDLVSKLPKIKDNVEIILTENGLYATPENM